MTMTQDESSVEIQLDSRRHIATLLQQERERQREQWGGPSHDDNHTISTWMLILTKHMGKLASTVIDWNTRAGGPQKELFRNRLIAIAAVCLSAAEAMERARWSE